MRHQGLLQGMILLGLIFFGAALLYERGLIALIMQGDKSYLSWLIVIIWGAMTLYWLWLLRGLDKHDVRINDIDVLESHLAQKLTHGWFAADIILKIGLLGTIIGFILMLAPIKDLAAFDAASLQKAIQDMSGGMAVALYTTLAGLIGNVLLRLQYQLLADKMHAILIRQKSDAA